MKLNIKFNLYELNGAFGDIGTDFPLMVGMISVAHLDVASVLIMYGLMQVMTGLIYGIPMPVQPLKAMAVLVIAQKATGAHLYAAGLVIGFIMMVLSLSGAINFITKLVPKAVVRGIQLGLGIQLATLAIKEFILVDGQSGYILAGICFLVALVCWARHFPGALIIIILGFIYSLLFKTYLPLTVGLALPKFHVVNINDLWIGFITLAITQLPLSLGNSILATNQTAKDLFPDKQLTSKKISLTYALMNLINPFLGGVPVCHGSGGMAGHYGFGARTGGSVIIYGVFYLTLGLFLSQSLGFIINVFPKPMLGAILAMEGLILMNLIKDLLGNKNDLFIAFFVAMLAVNLPLGYAWALIGGCLVNKFLTKINYVI